MWGRSIGTNVRYNYIYNFCSFFGVAALWVLYLTHRGMSLVEVGLLESIFHISSFIFEVPSGALADRLRYRTVLILGRICAIVSSFILIFAHDFIWFAVGFIVSAWSYNLNSGTNEALVYESLRNLKQARKYIKVSANINAIYEFTDTLGIFVAGWFVNVYFEGVYWIQIGISLLAILSVMMMVEPEKLERKTEKVTGYFAILKSAAVFLKENAQLRFLMFFLALFQGIAATYYFYFQSFMDGHGFKGIQISLLMIVSAVFQIIGAKISPTIEKKIGQVRLIKYFSILLCLLLILSFVNQLAMLLGCFIAMNTLVAISAPIFSNYFNKLIPSSSRATLLSVSSMMFSVTMILLFPLTGWMIEKLSFTLSFGVMGSMAAVLLIGFPQLTKNR
ncbi:MFS transporter [Sporolactobacillus shoreicorticis]|uniref:MFS transporter n=1 Tax=Sporolactobacillus shoreicorticis TaxID=1923877 RepID=A0ABW5S0L6_9BACL|nr:MFS transporter [Sporolactobacillus shoreicorticis]MCO7124527.1 MFS transporter [Sporolactobacillus shoreicorticis]